MKSFLWRWILKSLAWGAILLVALNGTAWAEEAQSLRSLQTGKELYARGEHEKAMEELKQAVTLQPDLAEAHFILGILYARLGKNDLARERFARVVELEPDHVQSHNNLGVIYQSIGLFDLAQEEFRKAIQIDPAYEPALVNLARLYLSMAARQYEDLIKLKPDDPELTRLYHRILALDPASPKAHYTLARLLLEEGKEAEALEELRQAERLDPAYGPIRLYQEGRSQEKTGNYLEAAQEYRLALKLRPDYPEAHYRLGMTQYFLEHYPEAVVELGQGIDREEVDQAELHHYLGHSYSQLGQGDRAMAHLQKALALKETPQSHWLLGQEYERRKEDAAAEREYQEVARLDPANPEVAARLEALKARAPSSAMADPPAIAPAPPETASVPPSSSPEKAAAPWARPDFLIGLEGQRDSHVLAVEWHSQRLFLYQCRSDQCQVVKTYPCSFGPSEGDLPRAGEPRRPEGIYFLVHRLRSQDRSSPEGVGAFELDSPHPIDRSQGLRRQRTDPAHLSPGDAPGSLAVSPKDLWELSPYIQVGKTPLVIVDHLGLASREGYPGEWEMVQDLVLRWKDAWENKRLEDYMAFYSREFASQGMGWEGWRQLKEGINQKAPRIQVSISDLQAFRHQDFMGVVFRQGYRSGRRSDEGWKRLYLRKEEGGRWRIVGEGWSPR